MHAYLHAPRDMGRKKIQIRFANFVLQIAMNVLAPFALSVVSDNISILWTNKVVINAPQIVWTVHRPVNVSHANHHTI